MYEMNGKRYTEGEYLEAEHTTKIMLKKGLSQKEIARRMYEEGAFYGRSIGALESLVSKCVKNIRKHEHFI